MVANGPAIAPSELGQLRLHLYPSRFVGIILCVAALVAMIEPERAQFVYLAVALVLIGACLITHVVTVHDDGIRSAFAGGVYARQVRFSEVVSLGYETRRVYINYSFAGLHTRATFIDAAGRKLSVKVMQPEKSGLLEAMRDHIARLIAARWAESLRAGATVPWSKAVVFTKEGLQVTPTWYSSLRGGRTTTVPYDGALDFELDKGIMRALRDGQTLCTFQSGATNFYPGFALLHRLRQPQR